MRVVKYLTIALAALIVILAAVAAFLLFSFDAARIKHEAARAVLAKTGRTLVIEGEVALRFWPSVGVKVGKTTLSEHQRRDEFARFDGADVSVKVLPLLSKQIVADDIVLDGLRLVLIRDAEGRLNIDDLLGNNKDKQDDSPPPAFAVASVRVSHAQLEWRDLKTKQNLTIADLDLATGRIVSNPSGQRVDALKLATRGKFGADNFDVALDVPALSYQGEQLSAVKVTVKAGIDSPARKGNIDLTVNDIKGTLQALKLGGLDLVLDAQMGEKSLKGKLKTPLDLDLTAQQITLPAVSGTLAFDMPGLPSRPLQLPIKGRVQSDYGKPAVNGQLTTRFDESHVDARFDVSAAKPMKVGFEIDISKLNVDKYLPPPSKQKQVEAKEERIDLSALRDINATGRLHVGELQVKNIKARNVRVNFKGANGKASVAPHSANLYGGSLQGALALDAASNRLTLKEELRGIDIQPLLRDVIDKDMVEGRGDITLDLATQGDTVAAMKKVLSGSARAVLRDGALKGINIAQSLRNAKAQLNSGAGGNVTQQASATDKTDFTELSASFKIAKGVAHNDDLVAKSPFLRLAGSGDIDIGNSRFDYLLKSSLVGTSAGQGGKETDALKGVTVPVRVSGPFEKPAFTLALADLAKEAANARLEEKKQEVKQKLDNKVQEKLGDKLKGIFGK